MTWSERYTYRPLRYSFTAKRAAEYLGTIRRADGLHRKVANASDEELLELAAFVCDNVNHGGDGRGYMAVQYDEDLLDR